jgi:hypothetical protein
MIDLTVTINPDGQRQTVSMMEAIRLVKERDYIRGPRAKHTSERAKKLARKQREYYQRLRNDPDRYKEYQLKKKKGRKQR